jgi:hypothetical protein
MEKFYWIVELNDGKPGIRYSEHGSIEAATAVLPKACQIASMIGKMVAIVEVTIINVD